MRYVIATKKGYVGKKGAVEDIDQAYLFETRASANKYAKQNYIIHYDVVEFRF